MLKENESCTSALLRYYKYSVGLIAFSSKKNHTKRPQLYLQLIAYHNILKWYLFNESVMAEYIGVTVLVTLRDPPSAVIRGIVTNLVDQRLCLSPGKHQGPRILMSGRKC